MSIPEAYTNNVGNLTRLFEAIRSAGVPERVTFEFLKTLGFTSSNDRPIISVLKAIGFLDGTGTPTAAYRAYRDQSRSAKVLAEALRTAYSDIFLANTKAHELPTEKLHGIIAAKTSKGDQVVRLIAATFKTLAKMADFSEDETQSAVFEQQPSQQVSPPPRVENTGESSPIRLKPTGVGFHYNIQIHLPTTTDVTVYNAIFRSLKEHLL